VIKILCLAVSLAVTPFVAVAQDLPGHYRVRDVAANDVLNIRDLPDAKAAIIGTIEPFAFNVEVLDITADGRWGRVSNIEGEGWAAMRYLEATPPAPHTLPRPMTCFGTEPFWAVNMFPDGDEYATPDGTVPLNLVREAVSDAGYPGGYLMEFEEGPTLTRSLIITREMCNDGMSDFAFGLAVRMFTIAPDGNSLHQGCCSLDHR